MVVEILDSWKEFGTNFVVVKTPGGVFTMYRRQMHYIVESDLEQFTVIPTHLSQKSVYMYWPVGENPMDLSKTSKEFRDNLSKIKDQTGTDPFELMELFANKEEEL